jgi:hypothetical protein
MPVASSNSHAPNVETGATENHSTEVNLKIFNIKA